MSKYEELHDKLEKLHKEATPMPWWLSNGGGGGSHSGGRMSFLNGIGRNDQRARVPTPQAELVEALRNNVPEILTALRYVSRGEENDSSTVAAMTAETAERLNV